MLFSLPHPPLCFEVPDEWWAAAGMLGFVAPGPSYKVDPPLIDEVFTCPIAEVAPMIRQPQVVGDFAGFGRDRLMDILRGFVADVLLPPVQVYRFDQVEGFRYRLHDGYHRFYASVAVGFSHLPAVIVHNLRSLPPSPFSTA